MNESARVIGCITSYHILSQRYHKISFPQYRCVSLGYAHVNEGATRYVFFITAPFKLLPCQHSSKGLAPCNQTIAEAHWSDVITRNPTFHCNVPKSRNGRIHETIGLHTTRSKPQSFSSARMGLFVRSTAKGQWWRDPRTNSFISH